MFYLIMIFLKYVFNVMLDLWYIIFIMVNMYLLQTVFVTHDTFGCENSINKGWL